MNIRSEDVVERLITLGYNLNDGDTVTLQLAISGVEQYIKNFCNIEDILLELYTVAEKVLVAENEPCRISYVISFNNINAAEKSDTVTEINQKVKLFISADINIDEGSIVVIEHLGRVREYSASGIPRVYGSHQEIMLVDSKCYA